MVGKPNLPLDSEARDDVSGAAINTQGSAHLSPHLTPLDEERQASMADEGGVSGAEMETQDLLGMQDPGSAPMGATPSSTVANQDLLRPITAGAMGLMRRPWGFLVPVGIGLGVGLLLRRRVRQGRTESSYLSEFQGL